MYIPIGYKFILGFICVVAVVAFFPFWAGLLGYSPEMASLLTYSLAMTCGLVLGSIFSRSFTRNITHLTSSTEAISQGDLTRDIQLGDSRFPDETRDMAASLNRMVENLREMVQHIREMSRKISNSSRNLTSSSLEINSTSEQVAQSMEQITRGAETQAEMVTKTSSIVREMAVSIELIARRAKECTTAAQATSGTARSGEELAKETLEKMKRLFEDIEVTGAKFSALYAKFQKVGKIADIIGEISRQTNILALNASIEAARAGEYGRGFSVVAEEVRKLADGTGRSASEILDLIEDIRQESSDVQATFGESLRNIREERESIDITAASFREIVKTVVVTEQKTQSILDLADMQAEGSQKIVSAIDEISRVAEDNAMSAGEVSTATEGQSNAMQEMVTSAKDLEELSDELLRMVERFRLNDGEQAEQAPLPPPVAGNA